MTSKESAILAQMQDLGYSQGIIVTAMRILSQSNIAQEDALLYLYDESPSEDEFIEYIATLCENK
ncbi:hypothetical protein [Parabacteroides leei]|jgi:hypothetical protein|uniref:hypothetical protein n=1 Tax=Parabacteroides leei TaxID=2939491 RepID=UPI0018993B80|nr:hypothetical protein [Parabacteroides goldsteinii]MBP7984037.1 hypothetical protein [Bacteroidaceae bacterium]